MGRSRRRRAAERGREASRAFAGAIAAGVVYDLAKAGARWSWSKAKERRSVNAR